MNMIGNKIREIRKRKGLSQEELAESSKVNLRTIQRIENNENEPRGKTLHSICGVLDINAEDILDYGKETDRTYLIYLHLSVIAFLVIPVGNIILPLILWLNKRDKIIGLKEVGTNLLNFQIIWSILSFFTLMTFALLKIMHYGFYEFIFLMFVALYVVNIILPVMFAVKANKGNIEPSYPNIIRLIK